MKRKLAAILAADLVGYSRLMADDEVATLSAITDLENEVLVPLATQHSGRIVKTMGDGFLLEFDSVVDAAQCAVAIQSRLSNQNRSINQEKRLLLRIGINLGDIITQDGDIYGDGVNVAARLEALANPGGIVLSRAARDQVLDKVDIEMTDLGLVSVKNIARPVHAYSVVLNGDVNSSQTPNTTKIRKQRLGGKSGFRIGIAIAVVLAVAMVSIGVFFISGPQPDRGIETAAPRLPEKPSIAVLPFDNLGDDADQVYFSDGLTEDLTTNLSLYDELFVISRNSAFRYRNSDTSPQIVGEELGVAYVLDGSVRREQERLRVNVQLVEADSGEQLWAERFDRNLEDIFSVQDEITRAISGRLLPELTRARVERTNDTPTENLRAWDLYLRARSAQTEYTAEGQTEAIRLAGLAIGLDPSFAGPHALRARAKGLIFFNQWSDQPGATLEDAIEDARAAVRLQPDSPAAYAALGYVYRLTGDDTQSISNLTRARELNPNDASIRLELAHTLDWFRRQELALPEIREALRLSPRDPRLQVMLFYKAHILFHLGRYQDSLAAADEMSGAISSDFWRAFYHLVRAANLGHLGQQEEAKTAIDRARSVNPNLSLSQMKRRFEGSNNHPENRRAWLEALEKAGLPET